MQNPILEKINKSQERKRPQFRVGDRVKVAVRLKEGDKERVQSFRGVVIQKNPKSGRGPGATFTVRKIPEGVGVERIFPVHSPVIEKIDIETSSIVRRSRLYYLRALEGKKARLKEAERFGEEFVASETEETQAAPATESEAPVQAAPAEAPEAQKAQKTAQETKPEAKSEKKDRKDK